MTTSELEQRIAVLEKTPITIPWNGAEVCGACGALLVYRVGMHYRTLYGFSLDEQRRAVLMPHGCVGVGAAPDADKGEKA